MAVSQAQNTNFFELLKQTKGTDFSDLVDDITRNANFNASSKDYLFANPMIFKQFSSLEEAFEDLVELSKGPKDKSWKREALDAFNELQHGNDFSKFIDGLNAPSPSLDAAKEVASSLIGNISEIINLGGSYKKDRLKITSDSNGIFDFSLASQGLYRPVEFYSQDYADVAKSTDLNEFNYTGLPIGVIPNDRVRKDFQKSGVSIYYFLGKDGKKYACERRQKGATAVFNNFRDKCVLKPNKQGIKITYLKSDLDKVFNGEGKIRLKYASSTKKTYLMFDRKSDSTKYVDIFVPINFLSVSNGNRMMNALSPVLTSITLEKFGIKTRISAMRLGEVDNDIFETISIPVKNYDEDTLSVFDRIMNLLGKREYAASFFAAHLINQANAGEQTDKNGNKIISGHTSRGLWPHYTDKAANLNLFMRYKNWVEENKDKDFVNTKVVNPNFQIFTYQAVKGDDGSTFYDRQVYLDASGLAESLPYLMYQFYWYMDFLSIEFNDMKDYVAMLVKRWEEDRVFRNLFVPPKGREETKETLRKYILNILVYKYYSSTSGEYADTPKEAEEKKNRQEELIEQMSEVLKNY